MHLFHLCYAWRNFAVRFTIKLWPFVVLFPFSRFSISDRSEIFRSPDDRHYFRWQTYAFLFGFVRIYVLNYSTIYALTFSLFSIIYAENNIKPLTSKHVNMLFVWVGFFCFNWFFKSLFKLHVSNMDTFVLFFSLSPHQQWRRD